MILLLSKDFDSSTNDVIDWLYHYEQPFKRINGEDYLKANFSYQYEISNNAENVLSIGDIHLNTITAIWYRRWITYNFTFKDALENIDAKYKTAIADVKNNLVQETRKSYKPFFEFLKKSNKKSLPLMSSLVINKVDVLENAKEEGINIPDSIVCNTKSALLEFKKKHTSIITKPLSEVITYEGEDKLYYTRTVLIGSDEIESLEDEFFPSFFQKYIEKEIEIRSFYLEGEFYSMAIFSQADEQTKIDFRDYNDEDPNRTVPFNLPKVLEEKLHKLMVRLKLNTGSLDLILSPNGTFYFLEVNPVGQFGMTSYPCNYYLEKKIAQALIHNER